MRVAVFASGSGGNCLMLSDRGTNILIDDGISLRRLSGCVRQLGVSMDNISGVLVTHEHSDHIMGLKNLIKYYDIPVFAPHTVANRMLGMLPEVQERIHIIPVSESFMLGTLSLTAFHTPHDTDESVGYRAEGEGIFAVATDMGHVTDEVREHLTGADTVLIESNHDLDMLRYGRYPVYLKRRILSDHGHLSNDDCAVLARALCESGTRNIILGHLSRENNTPETALGCVSSALIGMDVSLCCAPVFGCLCAEVQGCWQ